MRRRCYFGERDSTCRRVGTPAIDRPYEPLGISVQIRPSRCQPDWLNIATRQDLAKDPRVEGIAVAMEDQLSDCGSRTRQRRRPDRSDCGPFAPSTGRFGLWVRSRRCARQRVFSTIAKKPTYRGHVPAKVRTSTVSRSAIASPAPSRPHGTSSTARPGTAREPVRSHEVVQDPLNRVRGAMGWPRLARAPRTRVSPHVAMLPRHAYIRARNHEK